MFDWTPVVRESMFSELDAQLVLDARREGLEMRDSKIARWFTVDGVGFAGMLMFKKTVRLISAYTTPTRRRMGLRTHLIDVRLCLARQLGYNRANLITSRPDWYTSRGWKTDYTAKKPGWHWVSKCLN